MITGVAKKMAGVFFKSIDGVIANGISSGDVATGAQRGSSERLRWEASSRSHRET